MNYRLLKVIVLLLLVILATNCAKRGRPTGGAKDSLPPVLINATPKQEMINFKSDKIKLTFDEYVKLKELTKQLIVSPPLNYPSTITPIGTASKDVLIKINDTLIENTTYTFNFGNSIVDNNEENKLKGFKYVFSTGNYIDSLKINGTVTEAFKNKQEKDVSVLLYELTEKFTDSTIFKKKPNYVTSTLDSTTFEFTNLKKGKYLLLAIKQASPNYIYNPKQDKIAFVNDTVELPRDSVFSLSLFKEIRPFKIYKPVEGQKGQIIFPFEGIPNKIEIKRLNDVDSDFFETTLYEKSKDSINYWYHNFKGDSLAFEVKANNKIENFYVKLRTSKQDTLVVKSVTASAINPRDTIKISSNIPLKEIDNSKILLFESDSIPISFKPMINSFKNEMHIHFEQEFKKQYQLIIKSKALKTVFEQYNDSLSFKYVSKTSESFGILNLNIGNVNSQVLVELVTENLELIERRIISENSLLQFTNLLPKKYLVRIIFDINKNGKWDTGDFLTRQQPEKTSYYKNPIEIRANWEINETFILNEP